MNNLYFDDTMAEKIYNGACDMDASNDPIIKKSEIQLINNALDKIYSYSNCNSDMAALYSALCAIFSE